MSHHPSRLALVPLLLASCVVSARANGYGNEDWRKHTAAAALALGQAAPEGTAAISVPVPVGAPAASETEPTFGNEYAPDDYEFPDITQDLENYSKFVSITVGRGRKKKTIKQWRDTGVVEDDRVNQKTISKIVIHASLGQAGSPAQLAERDAAAAAGGKQYDSCKSSVNFLKTLNTAAHYIVCRDGVVRQMADIKDRANHVKDPVVDAESIGIETDTGYSPQDCVRRRCTAAQAAAANAKSFAPGDWDPDKRWRQSSSLARLIRYLSRATQGRIALDAQHVKTHFEVDSAYCADGHCSSHSDPGPYFKGGSGGGETVKMFGDPTKTTTPWGNIMRLVSDQNAPKNTFVSQTAAADQVRVADDSGLLQVSIWKLRVPRTAVDPKACVDEHQAASVLLWVPRPDVMPEAEKFFNLPFEQGEYQVEAVDLGGNRSCRDFDVAPVGPAAPVPSVAGASAAPRLATRLVALEERYIDSGDRAMGASN